MTAIPFKNCCLTAALVLSLLAVHAAVAEGDGFAEELHQAVIAGDVQSLISLYESLGDSLPADRQRGYLWAYTGWRVAQALEGEDKKRRKKLLKALQKGLEKYLQENPNHAEAMALLGSVLGDRISGPLSAMRLGGRASELLEKANELAPTNPRVALQRGVGFFFTPKAFGGGVEKAETELKRAIDLYEQAGNEPWPDWGYPDALARLGEVYAKQNKPDVAREMYQRALAQEPEYAWVTGELLPALESSP